MLHAPLPWRHKGASLWRNNCENTACYVNLCLLRPHIAPWWSSCGGSGQRQRSFMRSHSNNNKKNSFCFLLLKADFFFHSSSYACGKHESVPIRANFPVGASLTFLFLVCDKRYSSCPVPEPIEKEDTSSDEPRFSVRSTVHDGEPAESCRITAAVQEAVVTTDSAG